MQTNMRLCHIQKLCSGEFKTRRVSGAPIHGATRPDIRIKGKKCDTKTPVWTKRNQFLVTL